MHAIEEQKQRWFVHDGLRSRERDDMHAIATKSIFDRCADYKLRSRERDDMHAITPKMRSPSSTGWKVTIPRTGWHACNFKEETLNQLKEWVTIPRTGWHACNKNFDIAYYRDRADVTIPRTGWHACNIGRWERRARKICYDPANGMTCMQWVGIDIFGKPSRVTIPRTGWHACNMNDIRKADTKNRSYDPANGMTCMQFLAMRWKDFKLSYDPANGMTCMQFWFNADSGSGLYPVWWTL